MEQLVDSLFLDSANEYEIRQMVRDIKGNETLHTLQNMISWKNSKEYESISMLAERNNIMVVVDDLNKAYVKQIGGGTAPLVIERNTNIHTRAVDYYNPYGGYVDTTKSLRERNSTFDTSSFLDRSKSSFYKKNKSTKFKCMNSRLNVVEAPAVDDSGELENKYHVKKAKVSSGYVSMH